MIIQADEAPEFGYLFDVLVGPVEFKVCEIAVDREGFRLLFRRGGFLGMFRRWDQYKNLHEVIKSRYPEALL